MRQLEFTANRQLLSKKAGCDFSNIVPGSSGLLEAKFEFTPAEDWDKCLKAASFWVGDKEYGARLDENNTCIIPAEALTEDKFKVSVLGLRADGYRITTNKVTVRQEVW